MSTHKKKSTALQLLALLALMFFSASLLAADGNPGRWLRIVTGKVTDTEGNPLANVSVSVKNTTTGTYTNEAGDFSLDVSNDAVLLFSYVGFENKEVAVGNSTTLSVQLARTDDALQNVVVVGYSSKKTKYLSSAVSTVSGEKLRDVTSIELPNLLQGKVPGLLASGSSGDPTSSASLLIRGQGSLGAGTGPLIVVDGNIGGTYNPTDIESVTVLKDAAATGLYGSRAGNGVIIITTKSGKAGKTRVDVNSVIGFNEASTGKFKLMNSQELYDYQQLFYPRDPSVLSTSTDWWGHAFRRSMTQNHTVSVSGGTEKTQAYVSGNYYNEEGTLIGNDKKGYNFRANITHKINSKIKVSALLNYIYIRDNYNPAGSVYQAYTNMPFDSAYNADGTPRDPRLFPDWYGRDFSNFLHNMQYDLSSAKSTRFNGDLNLEYAITRNLTFSSFNRVTTNNYNSMSFYDKRSKSGFANNGELYNSYSFSSNVLSSNRLRYQKSFGNHNLEGLAVGEYSQNYYNVLSTAVKNLPPGRPFASTATESISVPTGGINESNFLKYLAQADYNYRNRYFAVASIVRERSSRFGSNNPTGTFYQLGASWIISDEGFMQSVRPITFLKLRVSHGTTGNASFGDYATQGLYTLSTSASYAGLPGAAPSQKGNPDLTWEKQSNNNIGIDIGFFNRINLTVDVYQRTAIDLLYQRPLPTTSGYSYVYENVGEVRNRGLEVTLNTKNIQRKDFSWETDLNIALNRNKVISLNEGLDVVSPGARQPVAIGHDMDEWYMPVWAGVDPANGDPLWEKILLDADGKQYIAYTNDYNSVANATSRQFLGKSATPKFYGGMLNTLNYKNFSLSAFANFVYGNYVYNDSRFYFDNDGVYEKYNAMVLAKGWSRWEKQGDIVSHPKPVLGGNRASNSSSTRYLEDGSYIRLRNITLGYNLPQTLMSKLGMSSARVFISGDNLWTGTRFTGPDPEVNLSSGESSFRYPISKKVMFGLSLSF